MTSSAKSERTVLIPPELDPDALAWPAADAGVWVLGGNTMGTVWQLRVPEVAHTSPTELQRRVEAVFQRVIQTMSPWEPASDLARLNAASAGERVSVDAWTGRVLRRALAYAAQTDGAFDPTVAPLVNSLGFGPQIVDASSAECRREAQRQLRQPSWQTIQVETDTQVLCPGGLHLDLCAIAKGFAIDQAVEVLHTIGLNSYLLEVGGEAFARGCKPDRQPWWLLLETPSQEETGATVPETVLALCGEAVATSGNSQRQRSDASGSVGHIVDPQQVDLRDGELLNVTVVHTHCMDADALATALFVKGRKQGLEHANAHGIRARFLSRVASGRLEVSYSQALAAYL